MNNNALVVVEMLHEVNLHAHISANPSPQNGHRSTIRIFEIQHRSSKQDLKAMPPQLFNEPNPFGTWKTKFL